MTPKLVQLAQELEKDHKALSEIKTDRAAASYKMKHGLAGYFMEDLKTELQNTFFCLN